MNDLTIFRHTLPDLSVSQIAGLPHQQLQEFDIALVELMAWIRQAREHVNAALDQRYGNQGRAALNKSGKDFGVCHLTDGPLRITVDVPKKVIWDQGQLAEIAQRIDSAGDKVNDYIDIDYSVPESRFNAWPSTLKETFAKARTVKPGKTAYRLAFVQENPA